MFAQTQLNFAMDESLLKAFGTMMALVGVAGAALWYVRKRLQPSGVSDGTYAIKVVSRHILSPRAQIAVVEIAGKTMLLGITEHSISHLGEIDSATQQVKQHIMNSVKDKEMAESIRKATSFDASSSIPFPPGIVVDRNNIPSPPKSLSFGSYLRSLFMQS